MDVFLRPGAIMHHHDEPRMHTLVATCTFECESFYQGLMYAAVFVVALVQLIRIRRRSRHLTAQFWVCARPPMVPWCFLPGPILTTTDCVSCCASMPVPCVHHRVHIQCVSRGAVAVWGCCAAALHLRRAAVRFLVDELFAFGAIRQDSAFYYIAYVCAGSTWPVLCAAPIHAAWGVRWSLPGLMFFSTYSLLVSEWYACSPSFRTLLL